MNVDETPAQKAIRLLNRQLEELQQTIQTLNDTDNPMFEPWRDTTIGLLKRFLGKDNDHTSRFINTLFLSMSNPHEDQMRFHEGCRAATETLKAAIREIEDFGVYVEEPKAASGIRNRGGHGGVTQTFHGPVSINSLAIATDDAVQNIGHMGEKTGASLKEITKLLLQSEELSRREVKEGLAHIEAVAVEVAKPEAKRDWKAVLERGKAILELTNKATDLATKIAPYTPAVVTLVETAKHYIK